MHPWRHFITITRHRHMVMRHCFMAGIPLQGLWHDLSKYGWVEFWAGARHYQGTRSPNEGEREARGYSLAWIHHKGRNPHHFEYWTDYNAETRQLMPVRMPMRYAAEMFCDRVAASKIYKGAAYRDDMPLQYYMGAKGKRLIHPETELLLAYLLTLLAKKGERAAFSALRQMDKSSYPPDLAQQVASLQGHPVS